MPAGSNGAAGIGVRKRGTVATVNDFGIQGIPQNPPSNTDIQNYINAQNPAGNGTDIISGSSHVQCSSAPP
jgi:large repetitive protein